MRLTHGYSLQGAVKEANAVKEATLPPPKEELRLLKGGLQKGSGQKARQAKQTSVRAEKELQEARQRAEEALTDSQRSVIFDKGAHSPATR